MNEFLSDHGVAALRTRKPEKSRLPAGNAAPERGIPVSLAKADVPGRIGGGIVM